MTTLGLPTAVDRTLAIMLTCIPMCMGVLAFTNNMADWTGTLSHVIRPLLALEALWDVPQFSWRALSAPWAPVCYGFVTSIELDSLMYAAATTFVLIALRATEARLLRADTSGRSSS